MQLLVKPKRKAEQTGQTITLGQQNEHGNEEAGPNVTLGVFILVLILVLVLMYMITKQNNVRALSSTSRRRYSIDTPLNLTRSNLRTKHSQVVHYLHDGWTKKKALFVNVLCHGLQLCSAAMENVCVYSKTQ